MTVRMDATQEKCVGQENGCMTEGLQDKGIQARLGIQDRRAAHGSNTVQDRRDAGT